MTNLITAQDISDFAPDLDTSSFSATTISGLITQAQQRAAAFCHIKGFEFQAETDKDRALISNKGELVVSVRRRPIVTVESIVLSRGGFSTTLILADAAGNPLYNVPDPGNRLHLPNAYLYASGTFLAGGSSQLMTLKASNMFCTIAYHGGLQTVPFDLKDALILWVQDIIMRRVNRAGVQSFSQGSLSMSFGKSSMDGDSVLIKEAKSILMQGGYVRPEIF